MTLKARYSLLGAGILAFVVGAPILTLYVQGKHITWGPKRSQVTGLISVDTNPSGASVYIGNIKETETPGAIRYLSTGDYTLKIEKDGYRTWQKQISVIAGRVSHASLLGKLNLIRNEAPRTLASDAELFAVLGGRVVYTRSDAKLVVLSGEDFSTIQTVSLPNRPTSITTGTDHTHALLQGEGYVAVFNAETALLTTYTSNIYGLKNLLLQNSNVWALDKNSRLVVLTETAKEPTTASTQPVIAFHIENSEIYYLVRHAVTQNSKLQHAQLDGATLSQEQELATLATPTGQTSIYVDAAKAVYILTDTTLQRINETAKQIAVNVSSVKLAGGTLSYTSSGELAWYDATSNQSHLVSRSRSVPTDFYLDPSLQYVFYGEGANLIALELDDRSTQNRYELDTASESITNTTLTDNSTLFYRTGTTLKLLRIF